MLCDWGVGYRVRVSASVDGYAIIVRGEYVIGDMKGYYTKGQSNSNE